MFQRLMAIPQEEYMQLTSVQHARQPLTQQFYNLEKRYQEGENILEPYKRLISQSETLDEMKALKEKMRQGIVLSTPKPYQSRAKTLFQNLESRVKFNDRGEIFDESGSVIPNSHLDELIQYAVRDRRRKDIVPVAWQEFMSLLRKHNIPKHVLNRNTIMEMEKPAVKFEPPSSSSTPSSMYSSPSPTSRKSRSRSKYRTAKSTAQSNIAKLTRSRKRKRKSSSDDKSQLHILQKY